ncbi:MAG TPA: DsbC family protein, partial [Gammaproteobacteria bacterium]
LSLLFAGNLFADTEEIERIRGFLEQRLNGASVQHVAPSTIPGLYEAVVGGQVIYITGDARYVLQGPVLDMVDGSNLTEPLERKVRLELLQKVPESMMVVFEAQGEARHTLTTFTDIDCQYCRRMHAEIDELNARGIRVRYMLYPRTGLGSPSHQKAVNVWCAEDRNSALTESKRGKTLERRDCPTPIREHMALAQQLGLTGTPFSITDTGEKISGYAPAAQMAERLDAAKAPLARAN